MALEFTNMNGNQEKYTQIKFGKEAIDAIMEGVDELASAVSTTLGPRGLNTLIQEPWGAVTILHDGIRTAMAVNPKDPFRQAGVKVIQEAGKRQRDFCGDGTTVVTILTQAILKESLKATSSGINPMSLRKGLEEGSEKVIKLLQKQSKPIKTLQQKIEVATISSEDPVLGKMIAETRHKIGDDGIMVVEESKMPDTFIEMQDGMQFERGYAHPFMITEPERMTAGLEDVHVLISDIPLNNLVDIGKFLETQVLAKGVVKMVFIVPEVGGDFLQALVGAKINGKFLGLVVKNPMVGSQATEFLQDLCAMTGAKLVSKEAGHKFEDIDLTWCGKIGRIVCTKVSTTITNGGGLKADVLQRIATIKKQMEDTDLSDFDKEKLKERLAKLTSGVAVVRVGGETEVEMKERKERAIDAIAATTAAIKYGIIAGGEIPYLSAREALDSTTLGQKILYDALSEPFKKLVANAGYDSGEMLSDYKHKNNSEIGFDVVTGEWKSMVEAGILDPVSVCTTAIKTAVSVSIQIMSIGAAVVPDTENEKSSKSN